MRPKKIGETADIGTMIWVNGARYAQA